MGFSSYVASHQFDLKQPATADDQRLTSESKGGSPGQASVSDSDEEPQGMTDEDLEEVLESAATPGYGAENESHNGAVNVEESIEIDDPGVLPAAEAPQSPAFESGSHNTVTYYSQPKETPTDSDFGPSQLTPRVAAKTLLWVKTSECCYAKRAHLRSCMTPLQFVDTILGLWGIQGDLNALRSVTYKVESAPWPVLMSDDIVSGHDDIIGEIGAWWERSSKGDDRCMVAINITL